MSDIITGSARRSSEDLQPVVAHCPNGVVGGSVREDEVKHFGGCFCSGVSPEVAGSPEAMGYCHCGPCRSWSGGPVNAFSQWKPDAVRILSGAAQIAIDQKTEVSQRQYWVKCGGHLMMNHPPLDLVDGFVETIPSLKFTPDVQVNYAETVLWMRDGLPKLKGFPPEFGGSGTVTTKQRWRTGRRLTPVVARPGSTGRLAWAPSYTRR